MPQFFPDGPSAVALNSISEQGGLNIPAEPMSEFDSPGLQGSMQQLLAENLGKFVLADFLVGVSTLVRRVGILYSVGRGFVVIYSEDYHTFQVCDIFSLKFISFFPPGGEPSIEELLSGNPAPASGHKGAEFLIPIILKAIPLALGIAVTVLGLLGELDVRSGLSMLGIGLACVGIYLLREKN